MATEIELPEATVATVENDDAPTFEERITEYELYWIYSGSMRLTGLVLGTTDGVTKDDDHPLAQHYNHFKNKKNEYGAAISKLEGTFGEYAEQFEEPDSDVRLVTDDELKSYGVTDDRLTNYPIYVPTDYELPEIEPEADPEPESDDGNDAEGNDICGAPKTDGKPCKWSPAESCPHHGDDNDNESEKTDESESEANDTEDAENSEAADLSNLDADKLRVVEKMLDAGFTKEEILKVCA